MKDLSMVTCDIPGNDDKVILVSYEAVPKDMILSFFRKVREVYPMTSGFDYNPPGYIDDEVGVIDEETIPANEYLTAVYGVFYHKNLFGANEMTLSAYSTDIERAIDLVFEGVKINDDDLPKFWIHRYELFYYYKSTGLRSET